jgi:hypothetical protein
MSRFNLTHLQASVLGCSLAVAGCLLTPTSHSETSRALTFDVPDILGCWELQEHGQLQASELRLLQVKDHWRRIYHCRETQQVVVVTLITGPSGPLVSHQPEICYARSEFCSHSEATLWATASRRDEFRFQTLEPRLVEQPAITIAYAWHDGDHWRAPHFPRFSFAGNAGLQRLQITMRHPAGTTRQAGAAIQQFIQLSVDAADAEISRQAQFPETARASY